MLFTGTGVALVTPFKKDRKIDYDALGRIVNHCIQGEADYVVVLGTTGEAVTLSRDEKKRVVQYVINAAAGRVPVVIGIGGNETEKVVNTIKQTDFTGISGLLSVTPYYNKPSQAGLIKHYKAIADKSPVPVILYNVPGRTGINMTAETTLALAGEANNIVAVKEASGSMIQMMEIIKGRPPGFAVISGDDAISLPLMAMGGHGVISVAANAFPKEISAIIRESMSGNYTAAQTAHYEMLDMFSALFVEGNPSGIKAALDILGLAQNILRLPLTPVSQKTYDRTASLIKTLKK
jgi:4-hydroxy-tetrahydrodipicolinate synthase